LNAITTRVLIRRVAYLNTSAFPQRQRIICYEILNKKYEKSNIVMRIKIIESIARVTIFTIGGFMLIGSYEIALRTLGVLIMIVAIGNELNKHEDEN
jgi:hypothetical protein